MSESGKEHSGELQHFAEEFVERCPDVTLQEQTLVLQEETGELSEEVLKEADGKLFKDNSDPSIEEEVGDVIFTAITVGLMAGVDPLQAAEDTALENSVRLDEVGR